MSKTWQAKFKTFFLKDSTKSRRNFLSRKKLEKFFESIPISLQENFWLRLENRILSETCLISEKFYDVIGGILNFNTRFVVVLIVFCS